VFLPAGSVAGSTFRLPSEIPKGYFTGVIGFLIFSL
jgi:hypothetical protein